MSRPSTKNTSEAPSLHKTEGFNGDTVSTDTEGIYTHGMRMGHADKIMSMSNAIKILPPNMIVNGRHLAKNIEAICGFMVTDEMMDEAYKDFKHEV